MDKSKAIPTPTKALPPFSCTYSPQLPKLLSDLGISLAISTYQAGKMVFISPKDDNSLTLLPRTFHKPMGFDLKGDRMVLACEDEVILFDNVPELAVHYPNKPGTYDALFVPRATFYSGRVDMHDIKFCGADIFAVNTSFSCLCKITGHHNFIPVWQPDFIDTLASEDRCHLNGLVLEKEQPKYVTALGATNTPQGWRENITTGGILVDVTNNKTILKNLPMPHSPQFYKNGLYLLLSATGQIVKVDVTNKTYEVIKALEGFCRGMDIIEDYAFIGLSKLRKNSSTFAQLDFSEKAVTAGIKVIHLPTRAFVGEIIFKTSIDEIYEIKVMPHTRRPNILNTIHPIHKFSLSTPSATFWANPQAEN